MMLGSPAWGSLSDKFGRRRPLVWATAFLFYFGMTCAIAPSFYWLLFLRFLVGFYIACVPQVRVLT